ncbi:DUF5753 domain-containing protein [Kitasatospora griseola]|uniref:DUF5753 domain-containing protein n=1 Tax=Kitasatospora griseola TaxID=2064 RepID=UPI0038559605
MDVKYLIAVPETAEAGWWERNKTFVCTIAGLAAGLWLAGSCGSGAVTPAAPQAPPRPRPPRPPPGSRTRTRHLTPRRHPIPSDDTRPVGPPDDHTHVEENMSNPTHPGTAWPALLKQGTGPTQAAFRTLVAQTHHYRGYSPDLIWGNLQTRDYATEVLRLVVDLHEIPRDIEAGAAERVARAQYLGRDGRTYHVLLGEQALLTGIGGAAVMRPQLEHLLDALSVPGLVLGVIPARARLAVYPGDGFGIFDNNRVEVEGYRGGETITDHRVPLFHRAHARLAESAVYGDDARALITAALINT